MAVYNVSKARSKVTGTSQNDLISNSYYLQATMLGGGGDDVIFNNGSSSYISGGIGSDYIKNTGEYTIIDAGDGNDTIISDDSEWSSIYAGKGNDVVSLKGIGSYFDRNVTVGYLNGDGSDKIFGMDSNDVFSIGSGSWSSVRSGSNVVLTIGSGKVTLVGAYGKGVKIAAPVTNQKVTVKSSNSNVTTGAGKDTIQNSGYSKVKISTGAGNDSVYNYKGNSATIDAGTGNDTILNGTWNVGSQIVYYYETGGINVSINAGDGDDKIYHVGSYAVIDAGSGNDAIFSYSANGSVNAGDGNDFVNNGGIRSTVLLGSGRDSMYNHGSESTIDAGADNDLIWNGVSQVSINAGTGNDVISLISSAENTTISSAENTTINYSRGDGNDTIYGFDSDDILRISEGTWLSKKIGSDFVLTVGSDTISMIGVGSTAIQIAVGNGPVTTINSDSVIQSFLNSLGSALVSGGNYNDSLYNSGENSTLDGGLGNDILTGHNGADVFLFSGGNDTVTNYSSEDTIQIANGKVNDYLFDKGDLILFADDGTIRLKNMTNHYITVSDSTGTSKKLYTNGATPQSVIKSIVNSLKNNTSVTNYAAALDKAIQDTKTTVFTGIQNALNRFKDDFINSGGGDTFLEDYCGIFLNNKDTGAITGWDAGGANAKNAESVIPEYGSLMQLSGNSFTVNGVKMTYSGSLTQNQQNIVNALYTWWTKSSLDLIKESYGVGFDTNPTYNSMNLNVYNENKGSLAYVNWDWIDKSKSRLAQYCNLYINEYYYESIADSDQNGLSSKNQVYLDRTIAHEFTHAVQFATFGALPEFFTEGIAELTHGVDDVRGIKAISNNYSRLSTAVDAALTFNKLSDNYPVGYMFWRYLGKQIADNYSSSSYSKLASNSSTTVKTSKQVISDSDYNSSLWGGMNSNSTLRSAITAVDDHLTVRDNLSGIDLGLRVDDISRQFSNNEGLILADNSNSSLNMLDTSNIIFTADSKKIF